MNAHLVNLNECQKTTGGSHCCIGGTMGAYPLLQYSQHLTPCELEMNINQKAMYLEHEVNWIFYVYSYTFHGGSFILRSFLVIMITSNFLSAIEDCYAELSLSPELTQFISFNYCRVHEY